MKQWMQYRARIKTKFAQRRTYFKILFSITGSTLTVVLLLSAVMYGSVRDMMTQQSITLSMQSFAQIQSIADTMRATANAVATQVLLDDASGAVLLATHGQSVDARSAYKAVRQLTLYKNVHESLDSIYLYNREIDTLVTSEVKSVYDSVAGFYDAELVDLLQNYEQHKSKVLIKRRVKKSYENGYPQDRDVYTYIVPNMYDGTQLKSAVVVNISADWLVKRLVETQNLDSSLMVVFDTAETNVPSGAVTPLIELNALGNVPRAAFRTPFLNVLSAGESYTQCSYEGEKYFLSYLYSPPLGWHFVKVSRFNTVFGVLEQLRRGVVLLVSAIIGLCLLLSLFGAGSLYRLFHAVEGKYNRIAAGRRSQAEHLRENFFSDFLLGGKRFTPSQLRTRCEDVDLALPDAPVHTLVLLRIEHYDALRERHAGSDIHSIKYGMRNVFAELCQPYASVTGMIGKDNTLALILTAHGGAPLRQSEIMQCFALFCQKVQVFVQSSYNLIGTPETVRPYQLPALYQKLCSAASESFFYPTNAYVDANEALRRHSRPIESSQLDHHILPALLAGDAQNAQSQYAAFVQQMKGCAREDFLNVLIWLGFSIARTAAELQTEAAQSERSFFGTFLVNLLACEKQHEIDCLFHAIFDEVIAIRAQANAKGGVWGKLEDIQRYLAAHYTDANLSLESVADAFGVSPSYLGKIFRKSAGVSMAEAINQIRLDYVLQQMAQTSRSVKDISAACGFPGTNYFYTYFKKKYGLTPQAYREKMGGHS